MAKTHWKQYREDKLPFCARMGRKFPKHIPEMKLIPGPGAWDMGHYLFDLQV